MKKIFSIAVFALMFSGACVAQMKVELLEQKAQQTPLFELQFEKEVSAEWVRDALFLFTSSEKAEMHSYFLMPLGPNEVHKARHWQLIPAAKAETLVFVKLARNDNNASFLIDGRLKTESITVFKQENDGLESTHSDGSDANFTFFACQQNLQPCMDKDPAVNPIALQLMLEAACKAKPQHCIE